MNRRSEFANPLPMPRPRHLPPSTTALPHAPVVDRCLRVQLVTSRLRFVHSRFRFVRFRFRFARSRFRFRFVRFRFVRWNSGKVGFDRKCHGTEIPEN